MRSKLGNADRRHHVAVVFACGDADDIGQQRWHIGGPKIILAPGDDRPVGPQCEVVVVARGNGNNVGCGGRDVRLSILVITPAHQRSITAQSEAVFPAGRHGYNVCSAVGHGVVQAPGNNMPVGAQSNAVIVARGNAHDVHGQAPRS